MNNSVVFSHSQSCVTIITVYFQNTVITLKRNPIPMSSHSPPSPWQRPTHFLSLWKCLLWTFHINGITQCGLVCLASLTRHRVFKVHPLEASVSASFSWLSDTPVCGWTPLCWSIHQLMDTWVVMNMLLWTLMDTFWSEHLFTADMYF